MKDWFRKAGFGMMVHYGLYSILAGEWNGKRIEREGEWVRLRQCIPYDEYHALAGIFNPIYFSADEWIKSARDAGMKYFVITAKHHDGFALFRSKVSAFNMVDATPFGRDIISELAESCYKYGLKFGVYYSQDLDWDEPDGGGFIMSEYGDKNYNFWDYPENREIDFEKYLENKAMPQIKELLTGYGDLCLIWFDCPWTITKAQSEKLYNMVKEYQPDCLVSSRLGNGFGDYESGGDNRIDMEGGNELLYECPATMNDTWGYKAFDNNYKSVEEIINIKNSLNARGVNYLLNVGPDYLGRFPVPSMDILKGLKEKNIIL